VNVPAIRLTVLGPGGIGKTSIGLAVLHARGVRLNFTDHVSCEGLTCASLVDTVCHLNCTISLGISHIICWDF